MNRLSAPRLSLAPLLLAAGALALTGCGGGSGDSESGASEADLVVDALDSLKFDSDNYTATAGEVTIDYQNRGSVNHSLLVIGADSKQIGERMEIGGGGDDLATYDLAPGSYTLFCDIPGHSNMKATLTVS